MSTMRTFFKLAMIAAAAAALALSSVDLSAQSRGGGSSRSGSSSRSSSSSVSRSSSGSTSTRSSGSFSSSSSSSRSSGSVSRSSSPQVNRSSQSTSRAQGGTISSSRSSSSGSTGFSRGSEVTGKSSSSSSSTRSSGSTASRGSSSSSSRSGGTAVSRPSGSSSTGTSGLTRGEAVPTKPSGDKTGGNNRGTTTTTTSGRNYGVGSSSRGYNTGDSYNRQTQGPPANEVRFDDHGKRVHPHDRPFMDWNRPGHFYGGAPHYFGYRVRYLPHYRRVRYWGIDYYFYNDIWYRYYLGHYVICRPPYGIGFAHDLYNLELDVIRFAYYNNVYRSYHIINSNYDTILEQNRIIAENNAIIASQNAMIAAQQATPAHIGAAAGPVEDLNALRSLDSYTLATRLGLIQSYAAANQEYYYDDGVFFIRDVDGQYKVIVPPAGALIKALPDDYETVKLVDNNEYYRVDDTIYRMTVTDGVPYFEVLGQLQENTVVMK